MASPSKFLMWSTETCYQRWKMNTKMLWVGHDMTVLLHSQRPVPMLCWTWPTCLLHRCRWELPPKAFQGSWEQPLRGSKQHPTWQKKMQVATVPFWIHGMQMSIASLSCMALVIASASHTFSCSTYGNSARCYKRQLGLDLLQLLLEDKNHANGHIYDLRKRYEQ